MQLVLYFGKKRLGSWGVLIVIHTRGINIGHFLVETPLTKAYFTDFCQQPFKGVLTKKAAILDPLVIQHIIFNRKWFGRQLLRQPDAVVLIT